MRSLAEVSVIVMEKEFIAGRGKGKEIGCWKRMARAKTGAEIIDIWWAMVSYQSTSFHSL